MIKGLVPSPFFGWMHGNTSQYFPWAVKVTCFEPSYSQRLLKIVLKAMPHASHQCAMP